jgi:hypothetical protein
MAFDTRVSIANSFSHFRLDLPVRNGRFQHRLLPVLIYSHDLGCTAVAHTGLPDLTFFLRQKQIPDEQLVL